MWLEAAIPVPLPLLETLSKIFKCQGLPVIFIEPRQYQQNTSLSVAASFKGRKKSHKERGQVSRECGIQSPFCFWPKTGECCEGRDSVMMQKPVPTLPLFRMFYFCALSLRYLSTAVKLLMYSLSWRSRFLCTIPLKKKNCLHIGANFFSSSPLQGLGL